MSVPWEPMPELAAGVSRTAVKLPCGVQEILAVELCRAETDAQLGLASPNSFLAVDPV